MIFSVAKPWSELIFIIYIPEAKSEMFTWISETWLNVFCCLTTLPFKSVSWISIIEIFSELEIEITSFVGFVYTENLEARNSSF